jgi:hypothetical protein
LTTFVRTFLKTRYALAKPTTAPSCPSDRCLAFEIIDKDVYQSEGGGHFLVVAFEGQAPDFPGLLFETPDEPPKGKSGDKVTYYHPIEKLHRLPGNLYSIVLLDSNDSIFGKAKGDFEYLLGSMQID